MPKPSDLALKLNRFVEAGLNLGLLLDINTHIVENLGSKRNRVTWHSSEQFDFRLHELATLGEYLYYLRERHFSVVTLDGSIIQMSFEIDRGNFTTHRLSYIPCPIDLDLDLLQLDSLDNVVEDAVLSRPREDIRLRGALRFDYDGNAAGADHPASHLTMNYDSVRIPVGRTLDASTFLHFIWHNFFLPREATCAEAIPVAKDGCINVLDANHRTRPHISWDLAV